MGEKKKNREKGLIGEEPWATIQEREEGEKERGRDSVCMRVTEREDV